MKTPSVLVLSTLLLSSFGQDCNNPLLSTFNLPGLDEPISGVNLPFCQDLQGGLSCCSIETVTEFQNLINNLQQAVLEQAGQRDRNFATLRNDVLNNYDTAVSDLSDFDGDINNLQDTNPEIGNEVRNQLNLFKDIEGRLDNIDDNDKFARALVDYQRKRVTCFNTLLQVQSSAWCLACNPDYANLGVNEDGSITFSQDLSNTIVSACLPFTESGQNFNALFQANQTFDRVNNLITYVQSYRDGGNVLPSMTISDDIDQLEDPTQRTNTVPDDCSGNTCVWQNDNLFDNGVLNQAIAANGAGIIGGGDIVLPNVGEVVPPVEEPNPPAENEEVVPVEEEVIPPVIEEVAEVIDNSTRLLQNENAWNPNLAQSGVQLNVVADPGQVSGLEGDGSNGNPNTDSSDTDDIIGGGLSAVRVVASGLTMGAVIIGGLMI